MFHPLRQSDQAERLDLGQHTGEELRANLADLARINRALGGLRVLRLHLMPRLRRVHARSPRRPICLLDVGTGSADIPAAIVGWARQESIPLQFLALDLRGDVLRAAESRVEGYPEIALVRGRALTLPVSEVDFAVASLLLHHLPRADAVRLLRELGRVARCGVLVNDLIRARLPIWTLPIVARLMRWSPMTRHDGRLSLRRAYTPGEVRAMAAQAGLPNARVHWHWPWRLCLVSDR